MQYLTVAEIIAKIKNGETFEAVASDYSFTLKVEEFVPYICGAVHNGHQFRKDLWEKCLHSEYDRWYEEDPCTNYFVKSHPIVIAGCDSRFEYDLNRDPENAIYEDAWGKKLWKTPLSEAEKQQSLAKHQAFYEVVHALVEKVTSIHGKAVVYDMHSYNWKRWDREVPVINLGTTNIDQARFGELAEAWRDMLSQIELPHNNITTAGINDTFQGNGYFLKYITQHFPNVLVLATEFSKIYCDELTGIIFPEVVAAIEKGLRGKINTHVELFLAKTD